MDALCFPWSFDIKNQTIANTRQLCGAEYLLLLDLETTSGLALKLKGFFLISISPFFLPLGTQANPVSNLYFKSGNKTLNKTK